MVTATSMILAQKIVRLMMELAIRHRFIVALITVPAFGVVAAFGIAPDTMIDKVSVKNVVEELALPSLAVDEDAAATFNRQERVQSGETIASLFSRLQVDDPDALQFMRTDRQTRVLNQLGPGKIVNAATDAEHKLVALRYFNAGKLLSIERSGEGFAVNETTAPLDRRVLMKSGEISSSLFGATDAAGLPDAVAVQLADIFSTDIDFHRDLRKGDRFSVVYELSYFRGEPVSSGRVLAAEFVNQGKAFKAVYFQYSDKEGGYYTPDGRNLRKQFLRSPLEFSRITSGFTLARFHPILQKWGAHKGIDYGAPTGARIKATADGVVEFAGRQGGYGNLIVLRHRSRYSTWYGHLSGFGKGLRKGARVAQGDVIGFVGATGLATGPHLHYEFRIDNMHQNPLRVAMPDAPPITVELKPRFEQTARPFGHQLEMLRTAKIARLD